ARKQYLAVRPDGVVDLVSLAKPQGATHGFRHRGLVAVSQRGFNIENGRHGALRSKGCMHWMVMQSPCHINAVALSVVVGGHRGRNAVRTAGLTPCSCSDQRAMISSKSDEGSAMSHSNA